ncbi:hypothetical protein ACFC6U_17555 [Kitasatospora purpeofusca]|uniref:hypothetical protein n=1 Tax=Kitasatospora purpeofusca TaxID=67352 RepID=UPI0035DE5D9F
MSTSVMPASAKNTVVRRRVAAVAATVLLAGSVQLLTAESSWACGSSDGPVAAAPEAAAKAAAKAAAPQGDTAKADAPKTEAVTHNGGPEIGFHMTPTLAVTAGGPKVDIGVGITNFTGAPYRNVVPTLSLATHLAGDGDGGVSYVASKYLAVEYNADGTWKKLPLRRGCDPTLFATPAKGVPIADGRANHVTFRVSLAADAPADLDLIHVGLGATAEDGARSEWAQKEMTVKVPKVTKPAPTTPAKPAPAKPAGTTKPAAEPTTPAKPAAKPAPVSDNTPAATAKPTAPAAAAAPAAPVAPKTTPTAAPATTAPAGTPELAQTGTDTPNGLLAGIAAGIAALGAGMVLTVRRLRAQR